MTAVRTPLLAAMFLLACSLASPAQQQFLNLDFEIESYRAPGEPWGWRRIPWGAVVGSVSLDTTIRRRGRQSLRLERASGRPIGFELRLPAGEAALRGKELTLTAWARSALTEGDLRLRFSASPNAADSALVRPTTLGEWTSLELRVRAPADSGPDVFVRFDLRGTGIVWLDNMELRVNGTVVDSISRGTPAASTHLDWLRRRAVLFPEAGSPPVTALTPLQPLFAGARVIGLGETTHGTSEFQVTKRQFFEFAAKQLDVTVIALEESQLTAEALNQWINGGPGDLPVLMANIYNLWRTEEMVELFQWLRQYNASASKRLELVGLDVPNINPELDSVLNMLPSIDPAYGAQHSAALRLIKTAWEQRSLNLPPDSLTAMRQRTQALLRHLESNQSTYRNTNDGRRVDRLLRYANAIVQGVMHVAANGNDLAGRDSILAANLRRALEQRGPEVRAVISAHSTHVSRMPGRMGDHLNRMFGKSYVPVTFTTFEGKYSALIPDTANSVRMAPVRLNPAYSGSIEQMLHQVGESRFAVDLRAPEGRAPGSDFLRTARIREIGIVGVDDPVTRIFGDYWDVIIHVDRTTATRFIRCPPELRCWFPG